MVDRVAAEAVVGAAEVVRALAALSSACSAGLSQLERCVVIAPQLRGRYAAGVLAVVSDVGQDPVIANKANNLAV